MQQTRHSARRAHGSLLRLYVWTLHIELECDPENVPNFGGSSSEFDQKYAACTNGMKTKAMNSGLETSMIPRGGGEFLFVCCQNDPNNPLDQESEVRIVYHSSISESPLSKVRIPPDQLHD
jgi:hypothetical protein